MKSSFSIIIIFIALTLAGCLLIAGLPVSLFPSNDLPVLTVSFSMPGSSGRVVESEVTSRLEGALAGITGVRHIDSESGSGTGKITVAFDRNTDIDKARLEASSMVRRLWGSFPPGVSYPEVSAKKVAGESSRPILTYSVVAPMSPDEIVRYADESVRVRLSDIPGVGDVDIRGAVPMEWRLEYDTDKLSVLGLTPEMLANAINVKYGSEFIGLAPGGDGKWIRVVRGGRSYASEFNPEEIIVTTRKGGNVAMSRLVRTRRVERDPQQYFRVNGKNAVYLNIKATPGVNQIDLSNRIREEMDRLSPRLPDGMEFVLTGDSTSRIRKELAKIYFRTGLTVLILLIFLVVVTRDPRYTLLTVISLVSTLAVSVIFYRIMHIEIQLYSLAGITISLNLVIDNIIVMCDHYMRSRDRRVFPAILAATLTTAGALAVVFFLDEESRMNLDDFVIVVIINLVVSLAVALFLVPALARRMNVLVPGRKHRRFCRRLVSRLWLFYRVYVRFSVRWRWIVTLVAVAGIGVSGWLFFDSVREGEYYGKYDGEKIVQINASLPNGSTLDQMNRLISKMEEFLDSRPEIEQYQTEVASGRKAWITVWFTPEAENTGAPLQLKSDVISRALELGGGSWGVWGIDDNGFNNSMVTYTGSYRIKLTGPDYDNLVAQAGRLEEMLTSNKRVKKVFIKSDDSYTIDDYTEYMLRPDMGALGRAGITLREFYDAISPVFGRGMSAGIVPGRGRYEEASLSSVQSRDYDVWALMNVPVQTPAGLLKVSDLAEFVREPVPVSVRKENQSYVLFISYDYIGSNLMGRRFIDETLEKFLPGLPAGFCAGQEQGAARWDEKDFTRYWLLGLVAAIIYFIGAVLFNSLRKPLAVIAVIPVSYVGIFLTFSLFHLKFDQGGFASFVLLGGITVNAAIYIICEYDSIRRRHPRLNTAKAYVRALRIKSVPVMMTVVSTVLGFIPFIVGTSKESFWYPLAAGTIGGLIFSLVAVVLFLPMILLPSICGRSRSRRSSGCKSCT